MPRSVEAYLVDIIEACDAIAEVLAGVDLATYEGKRSTRSAVEREFILIGEAVASIKRLAPDLAAEISHTRMIVGFRNLLTHTTTRLLTMSRYWEWRRRTFPSCAPNA